MATTTELNLTAMSDAELTALAASAQAELAARERRRKEETIAKIRELAGSAGLSVSIAGARGRPGGGKPAARAGRAEPAK